MHRLLERQLKRHLGKDAEIDPCWQTFLDAVSEHYVQQDQERTLLENALEINSAELNETNDLLRAQNAELTRTMLNTLSDGVYATDMDGRITFINSSAEKILGWKEHEMIGLGVHQTIHHTRANGDPFPQVDCPLMKVFKEGVPLNGDDHFIHRDGHVIPVSYRANPLLRDGKAFGSLVSFRDISRRLLAESHIRLQRAALDAAANMITITSADGIIEYVNPAFCSATGYQPEEVVGQHSRILKSGRQESAFYRDLWHTVMSGKAWEGELVNRRKDGSLYPEQMTITPIFDQGVITHYVAIKRDITEEAKIRTHLKLIETAIQDIDQGILISDTSLDEDGMEIQYVNTGFCRITGYAPQEVIGRRTRMLRGPRTDQALLGQLRDSLRAGRSFIGETVYYRKDGSAYDVELQFAPVRNDAGKVTHFIGMLSDISSRKQVEEALRQARDQALENSRLKSEFLSTMSHEIRTPMNGIIGMTDLLLDTQLSPEQRDFTRIVKDSANSLLTIINDILDFSKIEAGKLEIEVADFSPVHIVEGAAELLAAKVREKNLALMTFIDPDLPPVLSGDATRLRQVLLNLTGNAVKFTTHGEIQLRALCEGDGKTIRFEIQDTGIGLSAATQEKLFRSFTQADSSTTRRYGGTGLGLAISKRLVELMGGRIGVDSKEGSGSTFWFTLPLIRCADSASTPQEPRETRGLKALAVDDTASHREILHHYLNSWGMRCDEAGSAAEALALLRRACDEKSPYDIAIIDYAMPDVSGISLARTIRGDPACDQTRLLLLTAFDQRGLAQEARDAGFASYLTKPVRKNQLYDSIVATGDENPPAEAAEDFSPLQAAANVHDAFESGRLILLAEDNPTNQRVAQLQLGKLGYVVHTVSNGKEAVETAVTLPYAAILMDCQMPVMDGYEATAILRRAEHAGGRHVPIIAMTANAMQGDRERCLAAGMDDYISKPINPSLLAKALMTWAGQGGDAVSPAEHAMPVSDESRLLDFAYLADYFGDDPELIGELLQVFQRSTATLLDKLDVARGRQEAQAVAALAHEAKGACGNLGVRQMSNAASHLEKAAAAGDWPQINELSGTLQLQFRQLTQAIETYRKGG